MFPIQHTLFLFIKVVLAFFILYIFVPSRLIAFDEEGNDWTDKIFISLTHSNFIIIILVHFLVLLKIYETISLFIAIIGFIAVLLMIRTNNKVINNELVEKRNILSIILDFADGNFGAVGGRSSIKEGLKRIPRKFMSLIAHSLIHPFDGFLLFGVFLFAAITRFQHSFKFLYYGASDCYVHLAWTKYLGINKIYLDGVYPYGYEAIISAIQKLFFIDPATIIRFFGGIGSLLLIFSIYYILRKNLKNALIVAFIGVAAYVFGTELPNAGNNVWRQLSALPQEYAAIFILPGLHYLNLFLNTNRKKYLVLASEVLAITVFIHFYAAIFLAAGYLLLCLFNLNKIFKPKVFTQLLIYMGGGGFIGILPIITALAVGMKFHALSLGFVAESATINVKLDWKQEIFKYFEPSQTLRLLLLCACIIAIYSVLRAFFKNPPEYKNTIKLFLTMAVLCVLTYTQIRAEDVGFPTVMEFSRASTFFGLIAVSMLAMTIYLIEFFPFHRFVKYTGYIIAGVLLLNTVFQGYNLYTMFPVGAKLEYDEAAYSYYKIKSDFPILNWTIISPVEQYQESMGYGWHYNLWEFVNDTQIEKKAEIAFPTDYVFVIIEKRPLNQAKPYTITPLISMEDAQKPFPDVGNSFEKYYTVYENRRIVEAKAYYWMEEYIQRNDNFTVYSEDDVLKIYVLKQDGTKPVNLAN